MTTLLHLAALGLIVAGLGIGYRQWIWPYKAKLGWQQQGLLLLILLTLLGGLIGGPLWWFPETESFSWVLPPLASRMLAAAGWSFAIVCYMALQRPTKQRTRLVLILLAVYLMPLVVSIVLFHLNRFDFTAFVTYGFFAIALGMSVATLWYLLRRPIIIVADTLQETVAPSFLTRTWLTVVALVTMVWGVALFVTDHGPSPLIWVWPGDLLTSQLIGVMLLTIAAGNFVSLRQADTTRLMLTVTTLYGVGLALASAWHKLQNKPVSLSYLVIFTVIGLGSGLVLMLITFPRPWRSS